MFHSAIAIDTLWPGEMLGCTVAGRPVLLVNVEGTVVAYADRCAHLGTPLSAGRFAQGRILCAAHHWEYDARTGAGINPRTATLASFPVEIRDGMVFVDVGA